MTTAKMTETDALRWINVERRLTRVEIILYVLIGLHGAPYLTSILSAFQVLP